MAALTPEKFKVIGYTEEDANRIDRPTISYWQDAWRRLRKNPIAMGSLVVLGILLVMVIIGPHIKGYDYVSMNIAEKNQGVSSKYWFSYQAAMPVTRSDTVRNEFWMLMTAADSSSFVKSPACTASIWRRISALAFSKFSCSMPDYTSIIPLCRSNRAEQ